MPAVACDSLSQRCQWLSPVSDVHFLNSGMFLTSVAACDKTPALPKPDNPVDRGPVN